LVVDDNEVNLEVITDVLRGNGYPVKIADGGAKALEIIMDDTPDLVLLDLMMPEVSGEDVLTKVRETPSVSDLPIILLTARASQEDRILGLNMGADDYLAKPIVTEEILLRVKNILSRLDLAKEKTQKESMQRQNEIVGSLLELGGRMQMVDDIDEFLENVLAKLDELFDERSFGLVIEGARPKIIKHMAFSGLSKEEKESILSVQHKIAAGDSKYVSSFSDSPEISGADKEEIQKLLIHPGEKNEWVLLGGDIQGGNSDEEVTHRLKLFMKGEPMSDSNLNTIRVFIDQVIGASRNKLLTSKLDKLAHSDALTGAYNRAFFDAALKHEIDLNKSSKGINFAILMCDINGLKEVNDKHGHEGGDELIRACYKVLTNSCRESDIIVRLGGDEFLVLSPATTTEDANMILERIRAEENKTTIEIKDEATGESIARSVSMSIGIASTSQINAEEVLKEADKLMYADKEEYYKTHERYR
jgi:diguanylate cyclase (GGDEF)-like protein